MSKTKMYVLEYSIGTLYGLFRYGSKRKKMNKIVQKLHKKHGKRFNWALLKVLDRD